MIWRNKREAVREERQFDRAFDEASGNPPHKRIRGWSDEELHRQLIGDRLLPIPRAFAESELRRRESWRTPAKYALWVAAAALIISLASLGLTIVRPTLPTREHSLRDLTVLDEWGNKPLAGWQYGV